MTRLANGQVLMTVATGNIPESEAERSGLVPSHAYAVFDIREVNVSKIKNVKSKRSKFQQTIYFRESNYFC